MALPEIDYSEVTGKKIGCPDDCGICCLCQPEILPQEMGFFRKNHPTAVTTVKVPHRHFCVKMKKGYGPCTLLRDRRCTIYPDRPTFCRQFPFHFYVGDRISVELDLSCRGAWIEGDVDAVAEAQALAARSERRLVSALQEASRVYRDFHAICKDAGVGSDISAIRMSLSANLMKFTDLGCIAAILERFNEGADIDLDSIVPIRKLDMEDMVAAAMDTALESLGSSDPMSVPVYCDRDWNWNMFTVDEGGIVWSVMDDDGNIERKGSVDPEDIGLRPPVGDGIQMLAQYVSVLNGRESFLGNVYHTMDSLDYEDDMTETYYCCMCTTIIDLLWRASLLDHFFHTGLDADGIREAIIFFDMDRLDAPTIGAFV